MGGGASHKKKSTFCLLTNCLVGILSVRHYVLQPPTGTRQRHSSFHCDVLATQSCYWKLTYFSSTQAPFKSRTIAVVALDLIVRSYFLLSIINLLFIVIFIYLWSFSFVCGHFYLFMFIVICL